MFSCEQLVIIYVRAHLRALLNGRDRRLEGKDDT